MNTGRSREKRALLLKMEQCPSCFFKAKTWLRLLIWRILLPMLVEDRINNGRNELALSRGTPVSYTHLDVYKRQRQKLEDEPKHPVYIKTVIRSGYKIEKPR